MNSSQLDQLPGRFLLAPHNTDQSAVPHDIPESPERLRRIAETVAVRATELVRHLRDPEPGHNEPSIMNMLGTSVTVAETKSSDVDPVTKVDEASERFIRQELLATLPDAVVLGEEEGGNIHAEKITWVVDPIDGTVNFVYGIPAFAVSIAAVFRGRPVAGVVVDIPHGLVFSAHVGGDASVHHFSSAHRYRITQKSTTTSLATTMVATGFSYDATRRGKQACLLQQILPQVRDIRRLGSAAIDLCLLATGQIDAYYEHGLSTWDFAAGALIAARAGASVHVPDLSYQSHDGIAIIGGASGVHEELVNVLVKAGGGGSIDD